MTPLAAAALGILTVVLALAPAVLLAVARPCARVTVVLRIACAAVFTDLVFRVGTWAFASVHFRGVAIGALAVGAFVSVARSPRSVATVHRWVAAYAVLTSALLGLDAWALSARWYTGTPIEARIPLAVGTYCVLEGGNSRLTNPFHGRSREINAVDIVQLAPSGNRARRLASSVLTDYASFGVPVTSPCDGDVVAIENAVVDHPPGLPDDAHPSGNHVVVRCSDGLVKVAHLRYASVVVAIGERLRAGQRVASIGNSGSTGEPHLHVGGFPVGTPLEVVVRHSGDMPVRFDGRFLVTNDVFTVP